MIQGLHSLPGCKEATFIAAERGVLPHDAADFTVDLVKGGWCGLCGNVTASHICEIAIDNATICRSREITTSR